MISEDFTELVNHFLACRGMRDKNTRQAIIDALPENIRLSIGVAPDASDRVAVNSIVNKVQDYPDGLNLLLENLRFYDQGTTAFIALEKWLSKTSDQTLNSASEDSLRQLVQAYLAKLYEDFDKYDDAPRLIELTNQPGKITPADQPPKHARRDLAKLQKALNPAYSPLPPYSVPAPDQERLEVSVEDYLAEHTRITLLGAPGAGKSTTLRRLVRQLGKPWREEPKTDQVNIENGSQTLLPVPIFAALNRWQDQTQDLLPFLQDQLTELGVEGLAQRLPQLFEQGRVILLLDGLNELPQLQRNRERKEIEDPRAQAIAKLGEREDWRQARCVLSCRVRDFVGGPRWHDLHVLDLSRQQVEDLANAYFGDGAQAQKLTQDLMTQLYDQEDQPISLLQGLATQPFYLTKLLTYYLQFKTLPENPALLIKFAVEEALQREIDAKRIIASEAKKIIAGLGRLAFNMTEAIQIGGIEQKRAAIWFYQIRYQYDKPKKLRKKDNKRFKQVDHFFQLAEAGGLITRHADTIQFYHQLFQEYFCAYYCQKQDFTALFLERTSYPAFDRVWLLWVGLNPLIENELLNLVKPSLKTKILNKLLPTIRVLDKYIWAYKLALVTGAITLLIYTIVVLEYLHILYLVMFNAIIVFIITFGAFAFCFVTSILAHLPYLKKPYYAQTVIDNLGKERPNSLQQTFFEIKDADFYNSRGNAYHNLKQYKRAIQYYDKAIALDQKDAMFFRNRANAYSNIDQYAQAIQDYTKALNLNTKNAIVLEDRADAFRLLEQYEQAIKDYDKVIALEPKNAYAFNGKGLAHHYLKQYDPAIQNYSKAIALDSTIGALFNNRARAYFDFEEYQKAIQDYDKAIALDSKEAQYYDNRANTHEALKQYELAIQDYNKAIAISPKELLFYYNRANTYILMQDYEQAIKDYDKIIAFDPQIFYAFIRRGNAYQNIKQYERAIQDYTEAINIDSNSVSAFIGRGTTYNQLKQYECAIQDYTNAITLDPENIIGFNCRGNVYMTLKQYERAVEDYEKIIALDPKFEDAFFLRATAYCYLKQYQQARRDFAQAYQLDSADNLSGWMAEWVGLLYLENLSVVTEQLKTLTQNGYSKYIKIVCQGVASLLHKQYDEALMNLEEALTTGLRWDAPFWLAMVQGYLGKFDEALEMLDKALEEELPEGLMFPLKWFEKDQPEFYEKWLQPWLERHQIEL